MPVATGWARAAHSRQLSACLVACRGIATPSARQSFGSMESPGPTATRLLPFPLVPATAQGWAPCSAQKPPGRWPSPAARLELIPEPKGPLALSPPPLSFPSLFPEAPWSDETLQLVLTQVALARDGIPETEPPSDCLGRPRATWPVRRAPRPRPWGLGSPLPSSFPSRTSFSSPAAAEPGFWLCGLFSTPGAWVARGKTGKLVAHLVFCLSLTASSRGAPGTLTAETNTETRPSLNRKGSDAGARIKSGLLDTHQVEAVNSPARAAQSGALGGQVVQGHQGFFRQRRAWLLFQWTANWWERGRPIPDLVSAG
ncbi:uncharacterized protein [Bos taurus]|uniref:uncharacterized protein n=1 Tax=Bos taurus TaxID=9913 RepID=UPI000760AD7A|nr:uncharacterized protein LOC101904867 [Bos taurus]